MERKTIENILHNIVLEEKKQHNIDFSFKAYTLKEYYKSEEFKQGLKNSLPFYLIEFLNSSRGNRAYYNRKLNCGIVFIDEYLEEKENCSDLFGFLFSVYHEIRHAYQNEKSNLKQSKCTHDQITKFNLLNSDLFLCEMEKTVGYNNYEYDGLWSEIDANKYALHKTISFLEKIEQRDLYEQQIELASTINEGKKLLYDFDKLFELFNNLIVRKYVDVKDNWLSVFYNSDYSFKSISEIYEAANNLNINEEIVTLILTSNLYLRNIKLKSNNKNDLELYSDLIMYRESSKIYKQNKEIEIQKKLEDVINKNKTLKKV